MVTEHELFKFGINTILVLVESMVQLLLNWWFYKTWILIQSSNSYKNHAYFSCIVHKFFYLFFVKIFWHFFVYFDSQGNIRLEANSKLGRKNGDLWKQDLQNIWSYFFFDFLTKKIKKGDPLKKFISTKKSPNKITL